ncbi:hypothetical protein ATCC90586_006020 [Pythium insidiosum]|nr:hypothetical protein ATCC90586_006020 [Pythium insidiosum]
MAVTEQPRFCKVTVHRTAPQQPAPTRSQRARAAKPWAPARQTITGSHRTPDPAPTATELSRWTATGAGAVDVPTRRRAHTTATATATAMTPSSFTPLTRLTLRSEQVEGSAGEADSSVVSPLAMATTLSDVARRSDSLFRVDTDGVDPIRQTFDDESNLFIPATPPIPSGLTVDMLPTATFTPEIPSRLTRSWHEAEKDASASPTTTAEMTMSPSPCGSVIRISSPVDEESEAEQSDEEEEEEEDQDDEIESCYDSYHDAFFPGATSYMDSLPTPMLASSVQTPPLTESLNQVDDGAQQQQQQQHKQEPSMFTPFDSKISVNMNDDPANININDDDDDDDDDEPISSFIDVPSDDERESFDVDDAAFDVCDNFDAILGEPLPNRGSRWRFSITGKKSIVGRQKRGMSSPPVMVTAPPPRIARHMSVPAAMTPPLASALRAAPVVHPPAGEPLYHGQTLHLAFKASTGHEMQVSAQQQRVISKQIRCRAIREPFPDACDALSIIAHSTDGSIRGGDSISLARADGTVLRMQTLTRKLCFSPKIDLKAKFIVCGVPEGTIVTDTTKFYLQSVYDRSKTVGFLKSRRRPGTGYLVMYAYRTTDDRSEPIQFTRRQTPVALGDSTLFAGYEHL